MVGTGRWLGGCTLLFLFLFAVLTSAHLPAGVPEVRLTREEDRTVVRLGGEGPGAGEVLFSIPGEHPVTTWQAGETALVVVSREPGSGGYGHVRVYEPARGAALPPSRWIPRWESGPLPRLKVHPRPGNAGPELSHEYTTGAPAAPVQVHWSLRWGPNEDWGRLAEGLAPSVEEMTAAQALSAADHHLNQGLIARARSLLTRVLARSESASPPVRAALARKLAEIMLAFEEDTLETAREMLRQAVRAAPSSVDALEASRELSALSASTAEGAADVRAMLRARLLLDRMGQTARARRVVESALKRYRHSKVLDELHALAARAADRAGDVRTALKEYRKVALYFPDSPWREFAVEEVARLEARLPGARER